MQNTSHPTFGNEKICYIEIPALDINSFVSVYKDVFGWAIMHNNDGTPSFDDAVGEVSGTRFLAENRPLKLDLQFPLW